MLDRGKRGAMILEKRLVERPRGVVVLVHGSGEHYRRYEWLIHVLKRQHLHVITGDLPGHGETEGRRGHIDSFREYTDTVYEWYREAASFKLPIFMLGHSMGGLIVIRAVSERYMPVKGIILSSPALGLYEYPNRIRELSGRLAHRLMPGKALRTGIQAQYLTRNPDIRAEYQKDELVNDTVTVRWYQEMIRAMRVSLAQPESFPDTPLLVMQAGEDYIVDKEATVRWFNRLHTSERTIKIWNNLYHEILNEPEQERVVRYIIHFMNQHS